MKNLVLFELIASGVLIWYFSRSGVDRQRRGRLGAWLGPLLVIVGLVLSRSWIQVPPASVAAVYDPLRGGILPYDLGEGWQLVPPWATVRIFSVRIQNYTMGSLPQEAGEQRDDTIQCQTAEGLSLSIDCTVLFRISPGDANRLWKTVGPNYIMVIVRPNVREAARIIISEYPIMSVYSNAPPDSVGTPGVDFYPGKRQEVANRIAKRLHAKLKEKGVSLERFLLRNVDYVQETFEQSIVDKQVAQQRVVTQQYEAEIQRIRAQANVVRAEGDAEAIRLKAEALRVHPKVIEWELVQKLPDTMDVVILPGKIMPLVNLEAGGPAREPTQPAPERRSPLGSPMVPGPGNAPPPVPPGGIPQEQ